MSTDVPGFPAGLAGLELDRGSVHVTVDETLYPLEAVYGAAFTFLDRCYVLLDRPAAGKVKVTLASKKGDADEAALRAMAGELGNELLSCAWRAQITRENRAVIEAVTMQALGGAMGPPSLEDLAKFDFTEEPFEDPLGIAMSWEDKYKKKDKAEAAPPSGAETVRIEAPPVPKKEAP